MLAFESLPSTASCRVATGPEMTDEVNAVLSLFSTVFRKYGLRETFNILSSHV